MLNNLGAAEVIVISLVLLALFGNKKLNEVARGLGKSTKEMKKVKEEYQKVAKLNFMDNVEGEKEESDQPEKEEGGDLKNAG